MNGSGPLPLAAGQGVALSVSGVVKRYGARTVLRDVSMTIPAGQTVGLVGVNGAGKTTLIKCMLDFVAFESGSIEIFGRPSTTQSARAGLAYLPERFVPPYFLSGLDFLTCMSDLRGVPLDRARLESLLPVVDLDPAALTRPVRQLSKGMAQKLGILSCLLGEAPLLVLDEPMSGLDPLARASIKQHLSSLRGSAQTLFFSTHLLHDVETLCDQVAILHGGVLAFMGTPRDCCARFGCDNLEQAYLSCVRSPAAGGG